MRIKPKWYSIILVGLFFLLASSFIDCSHPEPPTIAFSPSSFSFSAQQGETTLLTDTLHISNSGSGTLDWSVSNDANWLSLSPSSGSSTGKVDNVTLSVDTSGMEVGNYTANITISASGASNSPQTIVASLSIVQEVPPETLDVHFIDVGQGDAILIDYDAYEMLIDGGRWGNCAAYIASYVDGDLEVMVATHPDADHIGGLCNVLDAFDVEHIWLNGDTASTQTYREFMAKVSAEGAQIHQASRGDQINLSTLTFDILNPTLPLSSDRNENSIVMKLSFGQGDFLFTGDVEGGAEARMVEANLIDDIDFLKVAHHGSKYSSTVSFLDAAQPEIAIYSAGANNPYGHPAPETIARLHDIGATIYGTDVNGTIIVTTDGETYRIKTEPPPKITYNLSINVEGQGTTEPSPGTHSYSEGTLVVITAMPASNDWEFDHWSGDASGISPTVIITMNSNKDVTAYFKQVPVIDGDGNVQITYIFYDGLVYRTESDEYVEITNLGDVPQDLKGWVLKDISEGYPSFTFPSYILAPGESIRVYTNEYHPEWGGFSFGYGKAIWNNKSPDTAALYNAQGEEVSRKSY